MSFIIAISSTNPAKTLAAKAICENAFPGCTVVPIDVPSGVREQPIGAKETSTGARNRARAVLAAVEGARMGMGFEGGVDPGGSLINCVAVVDEGGRENLTWGVRFPLPPAVVARVLNGEGLGPVMDDAPAAPRARSTSGRLPRVVNR